jgi:hypothetical protein
LVLKLNSRFAWFVKLEQGFLKFRFATNGALMPKAKKSLGEMVSQLCGALRGMGFCQRRGTNLFGLGRYAGH